MDKKRQLKLPSTFVRLIESLDENISVEQTEKKIINQALNLFGAKWGSIKYYYGNQFINGYSTVPKKYRLKPRQKGFMFKTVKKTQPHVMTEKILRQAHPEAHPKVKSIILAPLKMDAQTVATVSLLDVKDRTVTEEILEQLYEFGLVYGKVLKLAHKLAAEKKASKNRDKFMSFAAHELKNPLMALASYSHILKKTVENKSKIQPDWLEKMGHEINRMKTLIDELLDVRHSEDGVLRYTMKDVSLKKLIKQVSDNFRVRNPDRLLVVRYYLSSDDCIMGDETKLSQVFINLLNNAHKFSDEAKKINLIVKERSDGYEIVIEDKGIGISADEVPYIFNEFYRGTNGDKRKGIGVGLYLVKSIVNSHNGKVKVKSELNKGTSVSVSLPKKL